jgi:hypothetical protein
LRVLSCRAPFSLKGSMDGLKAIVLQHRGLAGADTFLMVNLEMYHGVDPTFGTKFNRLLSEQKRRYRS